MCHFWLYVRVNSKHDEQMTSKYISADHILTHCDKTREL